MVHGHQTSEVEIGLLAGSILVYVHVPSMKEPNKTGNQKGAPPGKSTVRLGVGNPAWRECSGTRSGKPTSRECSGNWKWGTPPGESTVGLELPWALGRSRTEISITGACTGRLRHL